MNKTLLAALVGVVGLALGFGAGWLWDNVSEDSSGASSDGSAPTATPAVASSSTTS